METPVEPRLVFTTMQLAPAAAMSRPVAADAVAWALIELRGPRTPDDRPIDSTVVSAYANEEGRALVTAGTFGDPLGPVTRHSVWSTDELFLNDDADPDVALREARLGVNELIATVDVVGPSLAKWSQPIGADVPRDADSVEVVLRRESGARERYVVPRAQAPAALVDAIAAAHWIQRVAQAYFRENPAPRG